MWQNPKSVPTETFPVLICFRKECSQSRCGALCWVLLASPSWRASSCLHLQVFPSGWFRWSTPNHLKTLAHPCLSFHFFLISFSSWAQLFETSVAHMYYQCLLTSRSLLSAPTAVWPLPVPPRLPVTYWIQGHWIPSFGLSSIHTVGLVFFQKCFLLLTLVVWIFFLPLLQ